MYKSLQGNRYKILNCYAFLVSFGDFSKNNLYFSRHICGFLFILYDVKSDIEFFPWCHCYDKNDFSITGPFISPKFDFSLKTEKN